MSLYLLYIMHCVITLKCLHNVFTADQKHMNYTLYKYRLTSYVCNIIFKCVNYRYRYNKIWPPADTWADVSESVLVHVPLGRRVRLSRIPFHRACYIRRHVLVHYKNSDMLTQRPFHFKQTLFIPYTKYLHKKYLVSNARMLILHFKTRAISNCQHEF
jgi:hypothetical protein